jgi:hypothetical protein
MRVLVHGMIAGLIGLAALAPATQAAGDADRAIRPMAVGPFTAIEVQGMAAVTLVQGDRESLTVEAPSGTQAKIRVHNSGGTLSVQATDNPEGWKLFGTGTGANPRITITFRTLESVKLAGLIRLESARIAVPGLAIEAAGATRLKIDALEVKKLELEASGAARIEIAGHAAEQRIELSGAGDYRAGDLASDSVTLEASGAARAVVRAEKSLDVEASGASVVDYVGNPKLNQDLSGAARVRRRDQVSADDDAPPMPGDAVGSENPGHAPCGRTGGRLTATTRPPAAEASPA